MRRASPSVGWVSNGKCCTKERSRVRIVALEPTTISPSCPHKCLRQYPHLHPSHLQLIGVGHRPGEPCAAETPVPTRKRASSYASVANFSSAKRRRLSMFGGDLDVQFDCPRTHTLGPVNSVSCSLATRPSQESMKRCRPGRSIRTLAAKEQHPSERNPTNEPPQPAIRSDRQSSLQFSREPRERPSSR